MLEFNQTNRVSAAEALKSVYFGHGESVAAVSDAHSSSSRSSSSSSSLTDEDNEGNFCSDDELSDNAQVLQSTNCNGV